MSSFYQLTHTGRQDTDEVLMFQNSAGIMDFVFDPFNNHRLVVGENGNESCDKHVMNIH